MKRPNWFLFITLGFLVKIFAWLKGQRIVKKTRIKGPAIALSNHTSFYDFIYTTAALYPYRVSYLAASKMFYEPLTGFFLRLARAIPKSLMQADPVATKRAFRILQNGGLVSIFPEGQISPTGTSLEPAFSIAKFIKRAGVDVYIVKHHNAYLVNPPWSKKTFKGRIETVKSLIMTKDELKSLSEEMIYEKITSSLYFSTSAYNKEKKYTYKLNDIKNLENVIYQCPSCLHEGLEAKGDHLSCPSCHHDMAYDRYGLLQERGVDELFFEQRDRLIEKINLDPYYTLKGSCRLQSFRHERLIDVGYGEISLNKDGYLYQGTIDGQTVSQEFHISSTPTLPSDIGRNIQIYEGYQIYQFELEIPYLPTKFVHMGEYLYQRETKKKDVA